MSGLGLESLILLPLLVIGFFTIQSDWRYGKIRRGAIRFGLGLGLGWLALYGLADWLHSGMPGFITTQWPPVGVATLAALLGGGGMWLFNVWSAADAKLFVVYTLLLPLPLYARSQPAFLAPIVLLVNTYTAAFVTITLDFLWRFGKQAKVWLGQWRAQSPAERGAARALRLAALRTALPGALKTFAGFAAIFLLMRLMRGILRTPLEAYLHLDNTLMFLILFLGFQPLHRVFQKRLVAILFSSGLLGYAGYLVWLDPTGGELYDVLRVGAASLALMAFRALYTYWAGLVEVTRIPLDELREHMILPKRTLFELEQAGLFTRQELNTFSVEGLTPEQVSNIRTHYQAQEVPLTTIEIERTIAFAPYLLIGVVLSILAHGPLLKGSFD